MKKFGFTFVVASGLIVGALGATAPAAQAALATPAGVDQHVSFEQVTPQPDVPHVDTTARHRH